MALKRAYDLASVAVIDPTFSGREPLMTCVARRSPYVGASDQRRRVS
ncbi:MAG: hypothetical protein IPL36_03115 [Nigerium sp.]|nr:hypothetical protein [Nigerium sp.]